MTQPGSDLRLRLSLTRRVSARPIESSLVYTAVIRRGEVFTSALAW